MKFKLINFLIGIDKIETNSKLLALSDIHKTLINDFLNY